MPQPGHFLVLSVSGSLALSLSRTQARPPARSTQLPLETKGNATHKLQVTLYSLARGCGGIVGSRPSPWEGATGGH